MSGHECPDGGACHHNCAPGRCFRVSHAEPLSGVFPDDRWPTSLLAIHNAPPEPMPATCPDEDPLARDPFDQDPRPTLDTFCACGRRAEDCDGSRRGCQERTPLPRVEVARKTDPIPPITVTPPASDIAGELARHIRDNLARLAAEPDLPARLISPVRGTLDMAERLVEAVALLEEQHEHMGERLQAANMLGHRRALALSLRCTELNTSEQARAELADLLKKHQAQPTPIIVPDVPLVPVYSINELARAITERITEKLAAEPLLRLLDAAREWVACPPDGDLLDELGGAIVDAVEACAGIETAR